MVIENYTRFPETLHRTGERGPIATAASSRMALEPSPSQVNAMAVTERVTSVLSLLGILFILSTFLLGRGFDKPINRLIFFASWSNLGNNIATLIAEDGTAAGQRSPLCQFQAFAIQMCV